MRISDWSSDVCSSDLRITSFTITDISSVYVVQPHDIPNPRWLQSGIASDGQRKFGDDLLSKHPFIVIPSAVSRQSWNIIFNPAKAHGLYKLVNQETFALDTRLNPVVSVPISISSMKASRQKIAKPMTSLATSTTSTQPARIEAFPQTPP